MLWSTSTTRTSHTASHTTSHTTNRTAFLELLGGVTDCVMTFLLDQNPISTTSEHAQMLQRLQTCCMSLIDKSVRWRRLWEARYSKSAGNWKSQYLDYAIVFSRWRHILFSIWQFNNPNPKPNPNPEPNPEPNPNPNPKPNTNRMFEIRQSFKHHFKTPKSAQVLVNWSATGEGLEKAYNARVLVDPLEISGLSWKKCFIFILMSSTVNNTIYISVCTPTPKFGRWQCHAFKTKDTKSLFTTLYLGPGVRNSFSGDSLWPEVTWQPKSFQRLPN